jgi:colanic acid/amylovoran biosynthesis protein
MRIFIEPGAYRSHNIGDWAMFEVAVARLRARWPEASLASHSLDPDAIRRLDPTAVSLDPSGSRSLGAVRALRFAPLMRAAGRVALRAKRQDPQLLDRYLEAVRDIDLLLVAGAGSLNDEFKSHALVVLETLDRALDGGATVAMMGQGLGPMNDPELRRRAATVFPRVDCIALREKIAGPRLLAAMGVDANRVAVTGDDAITLAYAARPEALGSSIGVNLRVASYSRVDGALLRRVGDIVRDAARRHGAAFTPIPTMRAPEGDDLDSIQRMIGGERADGPRSPAELLRILHACRIVVGGSYHSAVFALSMGIPVVSVANSDYYIDKFRGLAGQFGAACRLTVASDREFASNLRNAIDDAWSTAHDTREQLLASARDQIVQADATYEALFALVERRQKGVVRNRL